MRGFAFLTINKRFLLAHRFWPSAVLDGGFADLQTSVGDWSMIKSELIERVSSQNPHLFARDVEKIVTAILDEIADALSRGDRVELRGFGAFSVKSEERVKGAIPVLALPCRSQIKAVPYFKTGKGMHARLNRETVQPLTEVPDPFGAESEAELPSEIRSTR